VCVRAGEISRTHSIDTDPEGGQTTMYQIHGSSATSTTTRFRMSALCDVVVTAVERGPRDADSVLVKGSIAPAAFSGTTGVRAWSPPV
jgi:hypothetical protein